MNRLEEFNALVWANDYLGTNNAVSIICPVDESTPHLSVTVIPVDDTPRKKGEHIRPNGPILSFHQGRTEPAGDRKSQPGRENCGGSGRPTGHSPWYCHPSFDAISDALADICDLFTPDECRNFFSAAGYRAY
ncbi:MAG: hypothetical protein ABID63_14645 [Pseudomonadota bacterium]